METMDDYKKELDESLKKLDREDVMEGKVEDEESAEENLAWAHVKELYKNREEIKVKVGGMVNGGLIAYIENIRGFIPASQISLDFVENLEEWLGKDLTVRIITCDSARKKLVLSAKTILKEKEEKERERKRSAIEKGMVLEGKVETIQPYGAFIDLGDGVSGLLHVSQISEKRIKTPEDVLKVGDTVKVKVIKTEDRKISLSIRALQADEEQAEAEEVYKLPETAPVTTSLGDLLKNIKL
ncbi:MAG: S1 RNA-binding domain-containing protein [Lachnospiraceae bacterium]|nr:S1 RNA-binding domain-containing protein [Lachnospiraceae bacterium]